METLGSLIDKLFTVNHKLWNQEDIAQTPGADDHTVAEAKRRISALNLQRNQLIQEIDELIYSFFENLLKQTQQLSNPVHIVPQFKNYGRSSNENKKD